MGFVVMLVYAFSKTSYKYFLLKFTGGRVDLLPQENLYLVYDVFSKLGKNYGDINFVKFELWILIMSIFSFEYA